MQLTEDDRRLLLAALGSLRADLACHVAAQTRLEREGRPPSQAVALVGAKLQPLRDDIARLEKVIAAGGWISLPERKEPAE